MEFLNSEPYYASKKNVNQSSDFSVRRTGSYRHKKALRLPACLSVPSWVDSSRTAVGLLPRARLAAEINGLLKDRCRSTSSV